MDTIIRLYPLPQRELPLEGLYLQPHTPRAWDRESPIVYTNFIASLDGRIAIEQPVTGKRGVPSVIANRRDWRLYQELAARADVLLVSARYVRELARGTAQANLPLGDEPAFADLHEWRAQQGQPRQPAVVILSGSLDLPVSELSAELKRPVYVATGEQADASALRTVGRSVEGVFIAGTGRHVDGRRLIAQLVAAGFRRIYSIAGPGVLETLLRAGVLDRIYFTQVHRLIGGTSYDTLLEGNLLHPPADFSLHTLYYDPQPGKPCAQFFGTYELTRADTAVKRDGCD